MSKEVSNVLKTFKSIHLDEMDKVALMNRVDTKFIFNRQLLGPILVGLLDSYRVLKVGGSPISGYKNLYFDTKELKFYHDHHNGKLNRTKVRVREYANTGACFIEVKNKANNGRTNKTRQKIEGFEKVLSSKSLNFIDGLVSCDLNTKSILSNQFDRITLVNKTEKERVSIDFNLSFKSVKREFQYENLVIVEVKQTVLSRNTAIFRNLKSMHINPFRISKYCIGISSLKKDIKTNLFKEKLRRINKIVA